MILSNIDILEARRRGDIVIEPFDMKRLNPNSYNLRLHNELLFYEGRILDLKANNPVDRMMIQPEGSMLFPNILYLGRTIEHTTTKNLVPMLEGRSSLARLGISVHSTAGFGDNGFSGYWTLELSVVQPVLIYAGIDVCQIFYHTMLTVGSVYNGKYQNNRDVQPSMSWKDCE